MSLIHFVVQYVELFLSCLLRQIVVVSSMQTEEF